MVYNWLTTARYRLWSNLYAPLWPTACCLCLAADPSRRGLCPNCLADLTVRTPTCPICAQPVEVITPACGHCLRQTPPYARTHALFQYGPPVDRLILQLKFNSALQHARLFADLFSATLRDRPLPDLLIPVPLHPHRQRERGFNQAVEIARPLAATLGIPLDTTRVIRIRNSPPQSSLQAAQRRRNLHKSFALTGSIPAQSAALLDDVMTTGSTVAAIASLLRNAGVERVEVWVCARTPAPG